MTIKEIATALLRDWGVLSLNPDSDTQSTNQSGISTGDLEAVCLYINGALEEIFDDGPSFISQRPQGGILYAPTPVTLTVTNKSTTISGLTTWASWMQGCTIRIAGDDADNRLLSQTELALPCRSTTGSTSGTVYCDAIALPSTVSHLLGPVQIPNLVQLEMCRSLEEFNQNNGRNVVWTPRTVMTFISSAYRPKIIGQPIWGFVDSVYDSTSEEGLKKYLLINPMPGQEYLISYTGRIFPPRVIPDDIDDGDHTTDPENVLPQEWVRSVLLPIARMRSVSDPRFGQTADGQRMAELRRQFDRARAILENQYAARVNTPAHYAG